MEYCEVLLRVDTRGLSTRANMASGLRYSNLGLEYMGRRGFGKRKLECRVQMEGSRIAENNGDYYGLSLVLLKEDYDPV
ncbi:hypothetical protein TSUD_161320 [Trifolium subterraneum]|uniref:Uncharacterized protein n=1 Tax=Trifolium subterraneum TaxID=3900 RepID=A0A2Z6M5V0_TRISU|nr:hypothetical protein TSUD_161320 [Trifolium subterraneum]